MHACIHITHTCTSTPNHVDHLAAAEPVVRSAAAVAVVRSAAAELVVSFGRGRTCCSFGCGPNELVVRSAAAELVFVRALPNAHVRVKERGRGRTAHHRPAGRRRPWRRRGRVELAGERERKDMAAHGAGERRQGGGGAGEGGGVGEDVAGGGVAWPLARREEERGWREKERGDRSTCARGRESARAQERGRRRRWREREGEAGGGLARPPARRERDILPC